MPMKKFLLSLFFFTASAAYVLYEQYLQGGNAAAAAHLAGNTTPTAPATQQPVTQAPTASTSGTSVRTPKPTPSTPTPAPAPKPKPRGQYADGTYTGNAADAYYGLVQVRVTVRGGKLTDVAFLQYPNDRSTSLYINSQAMPLLQQEALQAQSANVSGVSGASETSAAFQESLASALSKAKS